MEPWEEEFLAYLSQYVTENKQNLIEQVIYNRTQYLTLALEHMVKPHNGSAALRTAECLGLQTCYVVTTKNSKDNRGIVKGATKWLEVIPQQANTELEATRLAIANLKQAGYAVVVTSPHHSGHLPETLPLDRPVALWLGNERYGASATAIAAADYHLQIPMYGFTESYNVSVSAALCLYSLLNRLRAQQQISWRLSEEKALRLKLEWYEKIVRHAGRVKPIIQKKYA